MPVEMVWNLKRWTKIQRRGATRSREGAWSLGKLESRAVVVVAVVLVGDWSAL